MKIKEPIDAFTAVRDYFKCDSREQVYAIMIGPNQGVRAIKLEASGDEKECIFPKKHICRDAITALATGVIIVHNHPSCNPKPSTSDVTLTVEIRKMLDILDISLMDHIIVADDKKSFYSFSTGEIHAVD